MTTPRPLVAFLAVSILSYAATAHADAPALEAPEFLEPPTSATHDAAQELRWYGWQVLAMDAGSALLLALAAGTESSGLGSAALASYAIAPPLLHLITNKAGAQAGASFALRMITPIAGLLLGLDSGDCQGWFCVPEEAWIGFGAGMVVASLLDVAVVSWARPRRRPPVVPGLAVADRGALLTLEGQL